MGNGQALLARLLAFWLPVVAFTDGSATSAGAFAPGDAQLSRSKAAHKQPRGDDGRAAGLGLELAAIEQAALSSRRDSGSLDATSPRVAGILNQVKVFADATRAGQAVDPESEQILLKMLADIEETIIPSLITSQEDLEREINVSYGVVVDCEAVTQGYTSNISVVSSAESEREVRHRECRLQRNGNATETNHSCWNEWIDNLDPCPGNLSRRIEEQAENMSGNGTDAYKEIIEQADQYMEEQLAYWQNKAEEYENAYDETLCRNGTVVMMVMNVSTESCDPFQIEYEHTFCQRSYLEDVRASQSQECLRHFNSYETLATTAESKTQVAELEYVSLRSIECYIHVMVTHNETAEEQAKALDACAVLQVDVSPVHISVQTHDGVSVHGVTEETHPGDDGWLEDAYQGLDGVIKTNISCPSSSPEPAFPTAPPTPAPMILLSAGPSSLSQEVLFPQDAVANFSTNLDAATAGNARSAWNASSAELDLITDVPGSAVICHGFVLSRQVVAISSGSFRIVDMSNTSFDNGAALGEVEDTRHTGSSPGEGLVLFGTPRSLLKNKGHAAGSGFDTTFDVAQAEAALPLSLPPTRTLRFCSSQPKASHVRISNIQLRFRPRQ